MFRFTSLRFKHHTGPLAAGVDCAVLDGQNHSAWVQWAGAWPPGHGERREGAADGVEGVSSGGSQFMISSLK